MDITREDYRLKGFAKKKTNNTFGDRSLVEYFESFSTENGYENLMVKETRTHTRNGYGIPTQTTVQIEWFGKDKAAARATKTLIKPLDSDDGMKVNEASRGRLINMAKGAVILTIGLEPGKAFMRTVSVEIGEYKEGDKTPLIDAINASALDAGLIAALVGILDVSYS